MLIYAEKQHDKSSGNLKNRNSEGVKDSKRE
jgi:hypothetical protein